MRDRLPRVAVFVCTCPHFSRPHVYTIVEGKEVPSPAGFSIELALRYLRVEAMHALLDEASAARSSHRLQHLNFPMREVSEDAAVLDELERILGLAEDDVDPSRIMCPMGLVIPELAFRTRTIMVN